MTTESFQPTKDGIQAWCQSYIANLLNAPVAKIDPNTDFDKFGLDSAMAVSMVLDLEEQIGTEVSPSLLFEYTTIAELAEHLATVGEKGVGAAA
jgi:acyl carrier protein